MKRPETTSASLHILAMLFMLLDHLWGTVVSGNDWMTCIGRLSMPIFAFLLTEGFQHTSDLKKYAGRMFLFALLSEVPFNLAMSGRIFYPVHQNILFSFLLCLGLLYCNEKARQTGKLWRQVLTGAATVLLGSALGLVTFVDYHYAGVLTVLVFYFFRGEKWWQRFGQFLGLWYINTELLGGLTYELTVFGTSISFHQQSFALLALVPIWLYRGNRGHSSKAFRYFCYGFYPVHLLILGLFALV